MKEKKMIIVLTSERVSIGSCSRMVCVCVCVPLNVGICIVQNVMRPNTIQLCHVDVVGYGTLRKIATEKPTTTTFMDYWDNSNQFPVFGHVTSDIPYNEQTK